MTFDAVIRMLHVTAGFAGLVLGAVAMWSRKDRRVHPQLGECYFVAISVSCASGAIIAITDWSRLWYFLLLSAGTYAYAVAGYVAGKRRRGPWLVIHVVGLASSYCGLLMAFFSTNMFTSRIVPGLARVPFFLRLAPLMFVSTCVVAWTGVQVYRGKLPKSWKGGLTTGIWTPPVK